MYLSVVTRSHPFPKGQCAPPCCSRVLGLGCVFWTPTGAVGTLACPRRAIREQQDRATVALIEAQEEKVEKRKKLMAEREVSTKKRWRWMQGYYR